MKKDEKKYRCPCGFESHWTPAFARHQKSCAVAQASSIPGNGAGIASGGKAAPEPVEKSEPELPAAAGPKPPRRPPTIHLRDVAELLQEACGTALAEVALRNGAARVRPARELAVVAGALERVEALRELERRGAFVGAEQLADPALALAKTGIGKKKVGSALGGRELSSPPNGQTSGNGPFAGRAQTERRPGRSSAPSRGKAEADAADDAAGEEE